MILTSGKPDFPHVWHLPELSTEERTQLYGFGVVKMAPLLTAGEYATVAFQFEVGQIPMPTGARFRIAWRWPMDWSDLQAYDAQGDGYMTVSVEQQSTPDTDPANIELIYHQMGDLDPWMHCVDLRVDQGNLFPGDRVHFVCGDRSHGSQGWRAPTCRVNQTNFLMLIDPDESDRWLHLADPAPFAIQPGIGQRLVSVASAESVVHEAFNLFVWAEDRWGNATPISAKPQIALSSRRNGAPSSQISDVDMSVEDVVVSDNSAVYRTRIAIRQPGTYCLDVSIPNTDLSAQSNPIHIYVERPKHQLFWGDLHSGQTEIGCGTGTLAEHYTYARDVSGLQFVTHQANDHYITLDLWQQTREQAMAFDDPGRFAVFLGCEWSPPTEDGGDRNVIYGHDESRLRRSGRFYTESDPDPEPDIPTAPDFHAAFKDQVIMVNMHVGGRPTNLDYHAPALEPLAEIHSTHGTSEWFVEDALQRGYKVGITAGADGVTGRPGADHPGWRLNRNVRSGLTAVYARELDKVALWEAFQARRCYATTGERIRLWAEVDGRGMGSAYTTSGPPEIKVAVEGTAAIERIDLLRGTSLLCCWQIANPHAELLRVLWSGTRMKGTARAQQLVWDGALHVRHGQFQEVWPVGFQSAEDAVQVVDETTVKWRSSTAGNHAGFIFRLSPEEKDSEQAAQTQFDFESGPASFGFSLNQVQLAPLTIDAGPVNRRVTVGPAPRADGPRTVEWSYRDTSPPAGETPYWIRVVQVDQARAWSSPVYVRQK